MKTKLLYKKGGPIAKLKGSECALVQIMAENSHFITVTPTLRF